MVLKYCIKDIVDDLLLYRRTSEQLLAYFITVLDVLKNDCATLNLKRCKWFQDRCKCVGMGVESGGTQSAQSQNEYFYKLE